MVQFTVYAPDQGMIIYRRNWDGSKITEGEQISAWSPVVAELPDFTVMESVTYVNEVDIQKIELGQLVEVGLDAVPDKILTPGVVTDVANIGEQRKNYDSKVFEVVIQINEPDSLLRPAMTTSNRIKIASLENALAVPLETIHAEDSLTFVYKRDGLDVVLQEVELGLVNENEAVINKGISENDELFLSLPSDTSGFERIRISLDEGEIEPMSKINSQKLLYNLDIALEAIQRNKLRALLTSLGIIFGVASVIAMLAIGSGAQQEVLSQMELLGTNNVIIQPTLEQTEGQVGEESGEGESNKIFSWFNPTRY